jgi:hypothetical protein
MPSPPRHTFVIPPSSALCPLPSCTRPQIFPYHLSEYVCRVQRASPFKYYSDVLFLTLKEERSYDTIPNFTVNTSGDCNEWWRS